MIGQSRGRAEEQDKSIDIPEKANLKDLTDVEVKDGKGFKLVLVGW